MTEIDKKDKIELVSQTHLHSSELPALFEPEVEPKVNQKKALTDDCESLVQVSVPHRGKPVQAKSTPRASKFGLFALAICLLCTLLVFSNFSAVRGLYYSGLGFYYTNLHDSAKAVQYYEIAYQVNPNDSRPLMLAAAVHLARHEDELAYKEFDQAIKSSTTPVHAYNFRGKASLSLGHLDLAVKDFSKVIELDPNNLGAYVNRSLGYIALKKYNQALLDCDQVIRLAPNKTVGYINKSVCYANLNRDDDGLHCIEQAIALDPKHPDLMQRKSYFLQRLAGIK